MIDTEEIQKAIERLYARTNEPGIDIPLVLQARRMVHFAKDYIVAASALATEETPRHWLPILQLTGHAVELSLKACLASANSDPPTDHDLIELYRRAEKLGFELDPSEFAAIVHLRHFYFQDLGTGTKFKTRYPTRRDERLSGSVPSHSTFASIVNSLVEQATQRDRGEIQKWLAANPPTTKPRRWR